MKKKTSQDCNWKMIAIYIAAAEAIGWMSHLLCGNVKQIYASLSLPPLAPAGWVFGLVWFCLFALVGGIVGWIHGSADKKIIAKRTRIIDLYWTQLILGFAWSPVFFRWRQDMAAVVIITGMILLNYCLQVLISRISKKAGNWMWVYIAWLFFAAYLNIAIISLN